MGDDGGIIGGILFLGVGVGLYYLWKKGKLANVFDLIKLPSLGDGTSTPPANGTSKPPKGGGTTTKPPKGGGTTTAPPPVSSTGTWYRANGTIANMPWVRKSPAKCGAGSGNSGGNRWENVVNGFMQKGLEVVAYFTIKAGSMCSGGHVGLKHGGPQHKSCPSSDIAKGVCGSPSSCCCWWDTGIDNNAGKAYVEIESSHPHNCRRKYYAAAGTKLDSGKPIGVRWHISREGNGYRLMQWIDTSGRVGANQWRQTYNVLDTGQFMPPSYKPTTQQNVEIRISNVAAGDIKMHSATSRKIVGGAASGYTATNASMYTHGLGRDMPLIGMYSPINRQTMVVPTVPFG